jgi:heme/copper-type cytochrome/quinol oxidase subunit 2
MNEQAMDILIGGSLLFLFLSVLSLNIYCLVDISKRKSKYQWKKMVWLNLVWTMPIIGSLIYLHYRKRFWNQV